ncbi:hypothetical protein SD77_1579 [Bacillus badius]|uniref:Uncharacterized protein n=1 Tax=Bacillus badius TaxID=1455 RepID=A0ABR5ARH9_BACBA|nr:hypothetical protein SD77_1579 [Bacillus badius]
MLDMPCFKKNPSSNEKEPPEQTSGGSFFFSKIGGRLPQT